jgi:hypothetical protein
MRSAPLPYRAEPTNDCGKLTASEFLFGQKGYWVTRSASSHSLATLALPPMWLSPWVADILWMEEVELVKSG